MSKRSVSVQQLNKSVCALLESARFEMGSMYPDTEINEMYCYHVAYDLCKSANRMDVLEIQLGKIK